ncbi:LysR family transcriptional regulator [Ornithinimicrobium sp. F0845]|uniref:LysR family transcriptional regulator n=1 Tax=Ornithinimicrobium sp. F0845 TaxID=2926412 RepID=UPI001FF28BAF|nr:LysR family transcriptional regulator [Ornithinimicrobium sp. F0845]MCK0114029.1 LysR family transcriptional regulator [Ornithinimicrobium sp. F0845]
MDFSLRQLRVFRALARTEHFGRAAELLNLSQPTVSADLRALERGLRLQLFVRSRAGTALTEEGAALLPLAESLLAGAAELSEEAERLRQEPGTVRLAATPSLINHLVPALLQELEAEGARVQVEVLEVATGALERTLAAGEADVGVGHFVEPSPHTRQARIARDEVCVLTARGVLDPTLPADLTALPGRRLLIWPRRQHDDYFDCLVRACRERGLDPEIVESPGAVSGAQSYQLRNGTAFSLVPFDFAREASPTLSYAPLEPPLLIPLQATWRLPVVNGVPEVVATLRRVRRGRGRAAR